MGDNGSTIKNRGVHGQLSDQQGILVLWQKNNLKPVHVEGQHSGAVKTPGTLRTFSQLIFW